VAVCAGASDGIRGEGQVTREEMELLAELRQVCAQAPAFALGFPDSGLPVADELEFGCRLVDLAQGILRHARQRGLTVAADAAPLKGQRPVRHDQVTVDRLGYTVLGDLDCPED
jgi:hypothetical protein